MKKERMFNPILIENFLSQEECDFIVNLLESKDAWEKSHDPHWDKMSIHKPAGEKAFGNEYASLLKEKTLKIKTIIEERYSLEKEVFPDTACLNRWPQGRKQEPHSDDMMFNGISVPGFGHRVFGSLIYLNNNFEGGNLYYPNHKFTVVPKPGLLAIHPGDAEHLHGVTEVLSGMRYTIASFWTYDELKSVIW